MKPIHRPIERPNTSGFKKGRYLNGVIGMSDATNHRGETAPEPSGALNSEEAPSDPAVALILEALRGLRFGTVSIVVQDGCVIQIDRTEKRRLR
jgi:hypothetical protein